MNEQLQDFPLDDTEELQESYQRKKSFRPYIKTFQRKAVLIAGITGFTTFVAFLLTLRNPPLYQGNFRILVEPATSADKVTDPSVLARTGGVPNEQLLRVDYPTQLEILRGPGMMSSIVEEVLQENPNTNVGSLVSNLRQNFSVYRVGKNRTDETNILEVRYQDENPQVVEEVLEAAAERYLNYSIEERKTKINTAVEFIDEQLPGLQNRLANLQSKQQQLQQKYQLINPTSRGQELFSQVHQLTQQQLEVQSQLRELKTLQNTLQNKLQLSPEEALAASRLSQDPTRTALLSQLQQIESQIAVNSARFTSENPILQELQEQKQNVLALIAEKTAQIQQNSSISLDSNSPALAFQDATRLGLINQLVETTNQIDVLETRYQSLVENKNLFEEQATKFPEVVREYSDTEQQIALTNRILDQLLSQRETLRVEVAQNEFPWELLSEPQIDTNSEGEPKAITDEPTKPLLVGALLGMVLGMGLAIFLEKRQDIFYSSEDLREDTFVPLLGEIPLDDRLETTQIGKTVELIGENWNESQSFFVGAFESLYAKLSFLHNDPPLRSLVVSSVETQDGQSTVALHLAKIAAASGKRVLLVDANINEPQLHSWLKVDNKRGLQNLLAKQATLEEVIQQSTQIDNLFVMTAGSSVHNSSQRLWSTRTEQIMKAIEMDFDLVIYDPPHFFDSTDSSFLAAHTDGILMVVGVEKTSRSLAKKAIEQINTYQIPIVGIVANDAVLAQYDNYYSDLDTDQESLLSDTVSTPRIINQIDASPSQQ